jgi:tRNA (guanine-N7-)-methyltransferase
MGQKKLIRFEEIRSFPNVLIYQQDPVLGGGIGPVDWESHFGNDSPVTLELACGKGDYTLGLARLFPGESFVGVDIKGNRIWKGARIALDERLENVAFLRAPIDQLDRLLKPHSVREIWITFPDPFLRKSKAKKRLTHLRFLHVYQRVLVPGGRISLKTDSAELYDYTKEVLAENGCGIIRDIPDVYRETPDTVLGIRTFYEQMHLENGRTIRYLQFTLPETLPPVPAKKHENATPLPDEGD